MNEKLSHERSSSMVQTGNLTDFDAIPRLPRLPDLPKLSALLKEGREKYGLKQKDIADRINVSPTIINRIETDSTKKPSEKVLRLIQAYTGLGYSKLLFVAGYSSAFDKEIYYDMDGNEIPYLEIVEDLYKADSELLKTLKDIHTLKYENILLLKKLITVMKIAENADKKDKADFIWMKAFNSIVRFLSEQLDLLTEFLHPAAKANN